MLDGNFPVDLIWWETPLPLKVVPVSRKILDEYSYVSGVFLGVAVILFIFNSFFYK